MLVDRLVTLGLVAVAGLALIPIVMVGRVVIAIVRERRRTRAADARRVTRSVAGLGEFSTTDDELWTGQVAGLTIAIISPGQPPTDAQVQEVQALIRDLPRLVEKGSAYLATHDEDGLHLSDAAAGFTPLAIEPEDAASFVLELVHPADPDGVYRVEFRDGEPARASRDD